MYPMYTKCAHCHLFVEENYSAYSSDGTVHTEYAAYVHLHRGDAADEELDGTHDAEPSGESHPLDYWRVHGPDAMRARFTD